MLKIIYHCSKDEIPQHTVGEHIVRHKFAFKSWFQELIARSTLMWPPLTTIGKQRLLGQYATIVQQAVKQIIIKYAKQRSEINCLQVNEAMPGDILHVRQGQIRQTGETETAISMDIIEQGSMQVGRFKDVESIEDERKYYI